MNNFLDEELVLMALLENDIVAIRQPRNIYVHRFHLAKIIF